MTSRRSGSQVVIAQRLPVEVVVLSAGFGACETQRTMVIELTTRPNMEVFGKPDTARRGSGLATWLRALKAEIDMDNRDSRAE
jgi:hypothetical protein